MKAALFKTYNSDLDFVTDVGSLVLYDIYILT